MRLFTTVLLLLTQTLTASLAIQIGRGLHRPVDSASSISSPLYRHIGYIDQKVRNMAYTSLNHEKYNMRKVVEVPVPAWNESMGPSNISSDRVEVDKAFHLPDGLPTDSSTNTSSSSRGARLSNIPALKQATQALAGTTDTDMAWDNLTDAACATALTFMNGIASNPSGIAACYNIRKYDNDSGVFLGDLRLFRIATPSTAWNQLSALSQKLEVSYTNASITSRQRAHKRSLTPSSAIDLTMDAKDAYLRRNIIDQREKMGKGSTTLSLPPVQVEEAKDMYLRRSIGTPPKMLQGLAFAVKIGGDILALEMNVCVVNHVITLFAVNADQLIQDNRTFHFPTQHHLFRHHARWHKSVYQYLHQRRLFRQRTVHTIWHLEQNRRNFEGRYFKPTFIRKHLRCLPRWSDHHQRLDHPDPNGDGLWDYEQDSSKGQLQETSEEPDEWRDGQTVHEQRAREPVKERSSVDVRAENWLGDCKRGYQHDFTLYEMSAMNSHEQNGVSQGVGNYVVEEFI